MAHSYGTLENGLLVPRQLKERIAELENDPQEQGWLPLGEGGDFEFTREYRQTITRLARLMFLKNPVIRRGVTIKADYVYGRGLSITAHDENINDVVQAFIRDERNQAELFGHAAAIEKERELTLTGNLFFPFFTNPLTGATRVRSIDPDEITEIVSNPDDSKEPWFYRREWTARTFDMATGQSADVRRVAFYCDWQYQQPPPASIGGHPVIEDARIYHVKSGGFASWKFGLSEIYAGIDWAKAYKTFLEHWATITAALARYAYKMRSKKGRASRQAAAARLGAFAPGAAPQNPPATTGATIIMDDDTDIEPIKTSGITTNPNDGRRIFLMAIAALGFPETFYGDVSVGTLATAESLDRPTELMIANRQAMWADVYHAILRYVLMQAVKAPGGALTGIGTLEYNEYSEQAIKWDLGIDPHVDVDFPPVVEANTSAYVATILSLRDLIPDPRELARMILTALGENDVDQLLDQLYPDRNMAEEPDPNAAPPADQQLDQEMTQAAEALREAMTALRSALVESKKQ